MNSAGLHPNTQNIRVPDDELLKDWGNAVRRNRGVPSRRIYLHLGKYDNRTIERRFGGPWSSVLQAFRDFAMDKPEWRDVLKLLPASAQSLNSKPSRHPRATAQPNKTFHPALKNRLTYGDPLSLPACVTNRSTNKACYSCLECWRKTWAI